MGWPLPLDRHRVLFRALNAAAVTAAQADLAAGKLFGRVKPADVKARIAQVGARWWLGVIVPNARWDAFLRVMPGTSDGWLPMEMVALDSTDSNTDTADERERVLRALAAAQET